MTAHHTLWRTAMFLETSAHFAQAMAIGQTAVDPYDAFYRAYELAEAIRAMSADDGWKEPTNAFRDAYRALVDVSWLRVPADEKAQQMALRRRELVAAGRAVLALPPPPEGGSR
jgi:hypothetical protein